MTHDTNFCHQGMEELLPRYDHLNSSYIMFGESTKSARMRTIVTTALQRQYSQTEVIFWITYVCYLTTLSIARLM
jgi:hypothetical protein